MRIGTNTAATNTYSNLKSANASKAGSLAKLSSGLRINKAGDDAAGLSISEKMKNQISGLTQATRNAQDGISLIQTAEGALSETHSILNRMRDLSVQASNETNSATDLEAIDSEMTELGSEIDRIAKTTKFNEKSLLATDSTTFKLQIGANTEAEDTLTVTIDAMDTTGLGIAALADITDITTANANAQTNIESIDDAIKEVSAQRTSLGANQNRLEHTINNLSTTKENLSEANSRITDVDMAEEMTSFTKSNILAQAATSMLAQANQMPQSVLSLLQ
jgi:flagellin